MPLIPTPSAHQLVDKYLTKYGHMFDISQHDECFSDDELELVSLQKIVAQHVQDNLNQIYSNEYWPFYALISNDLRRIHEKHYNIMMSIYIIHILSAAPCAYFLPFNVCFPILSLAGVIMICIPFYSAIYLSIFKNKAQEFLSSSFDYFTRAHPAVSFTITAKNFVSFLFADIHDLAIYDEPKLKTIASLIHLGLDIGVIWDILVKKFLGQNKVSSNFVKDAMLDRYLRHQMNYLSSQSFPFNACEVNEDEAKQIKISIQNIINNKINDHIELFYNTKIVDIYIPENIIREIYTFSGHLYKYHCIAKTAKAAIVGLAMAYEHQSPQLSL